MGQRDFGRNQAEQRREARLDENWGRMSRLFYRSEKENCFPILVVLLFSLSFDFAAEKVYEMAMLTKRRWRSFPTSCVESQPLPPECRLEEIPLDCRFKDHHHHYIGRYRLKRSPGTTLPSSPLSRCVVSTNLKQRRLKFCPNHLCRADAIHLPDFSSSFFRSPPP
ncbi:hypothetical protein L484_024880 [Morus notabilis]|uniref:Uncharacterized protein n=1 Tax=Morus notabilis TaxID=981085 RepID=W9QWK8_9ROSA|nr:hypothetical protein L484_024880 [Morus notabilis]